MENRDKWKEVEFKGREYEFGMLPVTTAAMLLIKLKGIASNTLRGVGDVDLSVIKTAMSSMGNLDIADASKLSTIVASLIDAVGEDVFEKSASKMMSITKMKKGDKWLKVTPIEDFNGRVMEYMVVVVLALRHNYADFFDGFLSKLAGSKDQTKTDSLPLEK